MKAYLNAAEVAKLLKVDRSTISRWLKKGILKNATHIEAGHEWRIPLSSYEEIIKNKK